MGRRNNIYITNICFVEFEFAFRRIKSVRLSKIRSFLDYISGLVPLDEDILNSCGKLFVQR